MLLDVGIALLRVVILFEFCGRLEVVVLFLDGLMLDVDGPGVGSRSSFLESVSERVISMMSSTGKICIELRMSW
jgi:hypothetical protein